MNCDNCKHYHWYFDWCDKWNCEVDARAVRICFEEKDNGSIPMSLCPDDEIQHVGYDAAQCGYEK